MAGNFQGRKLSQILWFSDYLRKFSPWNLRHGVLWCSKSELSVEVFFVKIVFFTNLQKFSLSKNFRYTVCNQWANLWLYLRPATLIQERLIHIMHFGEYNKVWQWWLSWYGVYVITYNFSNFVWPKCATITLHAAILCICVHFDICH